MGNLLNKAKAFRTKRDSGWKILLSEDELELLEAFLSKDITGAQFCAALDKKKDANAGATAFSMVQQAFSQERIAFVKAGKK